MPLHPLRADPTRTTMTRKMFMRAVSIRFARVKKAMLNIVVTEDCFGLKKANEVRNEATLNTRWRFSTDSQKVEQFAQWFANQADAEILQGNIRNAQDAYYARYVKEGYKKGAGRAFDDTRKVALHDQEGVRDFYAGSKDEFLRSSFAQPVAIDKIKQLTGRVFTELKGVDAVLATQITRSLADGLAQGANPRTIARGMAKSMDISRNRALAIARTETIRAHAEGQLDALDKLQVAEVGVMVEWSAAYDDRVCPLCADLDGMVLSIKEARGIIPRHSNCRCAFVPANVGESTKGQKRTQAQIQKTIDDSIRKEMPTGRNIKGVGKRYKDSTTGRFTSKRKRTLAEQKARSSWGGANLRPSKIRPKSILDAPKVTPKTPKPKSVAKPLVVSPEQRRLGDLVSKWERIIEQQEGSLKIFQRAGALDDVAVIKRTIRGGHNQIAILKEKMKNLRI